MARKKAAPKTDEVEDLELDDLEEDLEEEDLDEEEESAPKSKRKAKAKAKKEEKPKGIGARQMAERLEADPKTFRAWIRRKTADGQFPELEDREARTRYDFGETWTDDLVVKVMELWNSESHEQGEALKKANEAKASKKAPAKKRTRKKAAPKADDDEDDDEDEL